MLARIASIVFVASTASAAWLGSEQAVPRTQAEPLHVWASPRVGAARFAVPGAPMVAEVDGRGLALTIGSVTDGEDWNVRIATRAFGAGRDVAELAAGEFVLDGERTRIERSGLTEWHRADDEGVELGWTVHAPPKGAEERPLWLGLDVQGDLIAHLTEDRLAARFVDHQAQPRLYARRVSAWDASGRALDARWQVDARGLGLEVDARGAAYPVTIDPLLSTIFWSFETDLAGVYSIVSNGGDVNGDGFSDVVVAAHTVNGSRGRVWLFHGSPSGPATTPSWQADGDQVSQRLGAAVSTAGDVNNDGFDDLAIGCFGSAGGGVPGEVFVWYGSASGLGANGLPSNADFRFTEAAFGDLQQGTGAFYPGNVVHDWVNTAGDVNGDGFDDLVVGAVGVDGAQPNEGKVYVFFGSATGLSTSNKWEYASGAGVADTLFGASVSTAGDVNGDGFDDLLVGAPRWDMLGNDRGFVLVFHGSPTFSLVTAPSWTHAAEECQNANDPASIGFSVSTAGDINGDGFADVVVGEPFGDCNQADEGLVLVYFGSSVGLSTGAFDRRIEGEENFGQAGWAVCAAGDVDADGFADIALSRVVGNGMIHGALFLDVGAAGYGGIVGLPAIAQVATGPNPNGSYGDTLSGAGDVDGDGFADVIVGMRAYTLGGQSPEGRAMVHRGAPRPALAGARVTSATDSSSTGFGSAVQSAGDVNKDGWNDLVVGAPLYESGPLNVDEGRVKVFLGTPTGLASTPVFTFESDVAGALLGASVAGAGDVDNEGQSDLVIGAPGYSNGEPNEGRVYLFLRGASAFPATPSSTFESNVPDAELGASVATAGDVNGDGYADMIVGAPGFSSDRGRAYLFLGRGALGFPSAPDWTFEGGHSGERFGSVVATAGDVNQDGYSDVLIGAPGYSGVNPQEGRVYLFLGTPSGFGLQLAPVTVLDGGLPGGRFGTAAAIAGDFDRDGRADVLVGAPASVGSPTSARVLAFRGSSSIPGLETSPFATLTGAAADSFGAAVSGGDCNGDGIPDVVVGLPTWANSDEGRIEVYLGGSSAIAGVPGYTRNGAVDGRRLGTVLAMEADYDGDGRADLAAGGPGDGTGSGVGQVISGGEVGGRMYGSQQRVSTSGRAQDLLSLTDTTGQFALVMGSPGVNGVALPGTPGGRDRVHLEFEVESVGWTFDGDDVFMGAKLDSGHPTLGTVPEVGANVTEITHGLALLPGTGYLWRSRVATDSPFFPHGPWTTRLGNGLIGRKIGTGFDCNQNGIEDSVEVALNPNLDCNQNRVPDDCDLASGFEQDCDGDLVPDSCELFANDCDGDGCPDDCELAGTALCTPFGSVNCDGDNKLDVCEIATDPLLDLNGDGFLDECQFAPYCSGDGTAAACPCGNNGGAGRGCANSVNANGAVLTVTGEPSITTDTLVLHGAGMPNSVSPSAIYLQGTAQDNGGLGTPIQDGLRCVTGSLIRLGTRPNSGNQSQYPDVGNQVISVRGGLSSLPPPQTRHYQVFYRNAAAAFCPPGTANWTNGFSVVWH